MRKLMRANFYRLWKSRVFWICVAASFLISAAFRLAKQYPSQEMPSLDEMYLQIFPMLPLIHGVFAGLFLGTEYQDGTLRNKVTVGHTRGEIYLSFLAVCLCAGLGILLGWALGVAVGALKYGWFLAPGRQLLLNFGIIVLLTMAEDGIMERKKKGVEKAGLAKHIRQMRSCRSKNNENYNKTNSFIQ